MYSKTIIGRIVLLNADYYSLLSFSVDMLSICLLGITSNNNMYFLKNHKTIASRYFIV